MEQGTANPRMGMPLTIGDALGVGLPALVEPPARAPVTVTRRGEGAALWTSASGGRGVRVAGTGSPDVLELWDWTLASGDRHDSPAHTPGTTELVQVQEGAVMLAVGDEQVTLETRDVATLRGDVPHSYANPHDGADRFSLAVFEPGLGPTPTPGPARG